MIDPQKLAQALQKKTATALGVRWLYRFQSYDASRLALLLSARVMRASNPKFFNDPYDCRPFFDAHSFETPEAIGGFEKLLLATSAANMNPEESATFDATMAKFKESPEFRAQAVYKISSALTEVALKHRIICLSRDPFSSLLWSHYGDAHRGVCIELDTTKSPFGAALQVKYESAYPQLNFLGDSVGAIAEVTLLTKANCWEYEQEFRLIASDIEGSIHHRCNQDLVDIPKGAVTAIILGHKCTPAMTEEARGLIMRYAPEVELRQLVRQTAAYDLRYIRLQLDRPVADQIGGSTPQDGCDRP